MGKARPREGPKLRGLGAFSPLRGGKAGGVAKRVCNKKVRCSRTAARGAGGGGGPGQAGTLCPLRGCRRLGAGKLHLGQRRAKEAGHGRGSRPNLAPKAASGKPSPAPRPGFSRFRHPRRSSSTSGEKPGAPRSDPAAQRAGASGRGRPRAGREGACEPSESRLCACAGRSRPAPWNSSEADVARARDSRRGSAPYAWASRRVRRELHGAAGEVRARRHRHRGLSPLLLPPRRGRGSCRTLCPEGAGSGPLPPGGRAWALDPFVFRSPLSWSGESRPSHLLSPRSSLQGQEGNLGG